MDNEQLSMDFSSPAPPSSDTVEVSYELLDFQLADLMLELNGQKSGEKNSILKGCTLEISKHTREGQIAIPCSSEQQAELLKTHVVGQVDSKGADYKPLVIDQDYLYLRRYWQYQNLLANQINKRLEGSERSEEFNDWIKQRLAFYFKDSGESSAMEPVTDWQKVAAEGALHSRFLILSGGPGTGKTTTITRILALLIESYLHPFSDQQNTLKHSPAELSRSTSPVLDTFVEQANNNPLRILLAAPTGKAAIRMVDAIRESQQTLDLPNNVLEQMPTQASTIHKLLGYIHGKVGFKHNRSNPLNADVVLVDEASMIDIALMSKLIEAVPAHAKLILIGDKDQLSSVETGSVFADICEGLKNSDKLVTLQKNWRFANDSGIGQLAIATNRGEDKKLLEILHDDSEQSCQLIPPTVIAGSLITKDFLEPWGNYFKVLNNPNSTPQEIFSAFNEYRILCALRQGLNGSTIMNSRIEASLIKLGFIKAKNGAQAKNRTGGNAGWYHGRPVMVTKNDYGKGLFNGDMGIALIEKGKVNVYFPDGADNTVKAYSPVRLPAHETTWAMTIHKSQGSEFNQVALILPHEVMPLLTRQLIYTGITRARKKVSIVASEGVLSAGVKSEMVRATNIKNKLTN